MSKQRNLCHCGCGYPTAQRNGYVLGHKPLAADRAQIVAGIQRALQRGSLTAVANASGGNSVHLGIDEGSYTTSTLCGALEHRGTETTDTPANCSGCASLVRDAGHWDLLKDEDGWTGLYEPRRRY